MASESLAIRLLRPEPCRRCNFAQLLLSVVVTNGPTIVPIDYSILWWPLTCLLFTSPSFSRATPFQLIQIKVTRITNSQYTVKMLEFFLRNYLLLANNSYITILRHSIHLKMPELIIFEICRPSLLSTGEKKSGLENRGSFGIRICAGHSRKYHITEQRLLKDIKPGKFFRLGL